MSVQFSKLSNGSWGVRVYGRCPTIGERVTVERRDGSTTTAIVASIVSRTPQHTTCAIEAKRPSRRSPSRWQGKRAGGVTFAVAPDRVPLEIDWDAEAEAEERAERARAAREQASIAGRDRGFFQGDGPGSLLEDFGPNPFGDLSDEQTDRLERDTTPAPFMWAAFDDHADDWSR